MKKGLKIVGRFWIVLILTAFITGFIQYLYRSLGIDYEAYTSIITMGGLVYIFIIDQNKIQFFWSAGENREGLSRKPTILLKITAVLIIGVPVVMHWM
ncbi:hypothetical protein LGQ02_01435 [Bacillus shivajii]|uniref:hypothetical protein n=1 Tax=Bacillus shivajii TaxID=1983719 RepID=UPI001CFA806A|nr:hypothetical protein [Bacillus shivajii]UCZ53492.1 hypothetical protein LGQ02_01435 [Bacillus shivajii]